MDYIFRGKRVDNGEWVEGKNIFCTVDNCVYITPKGTGIRYGKDVETSEELLQCKTHSVIPETVGMWTGLTDKNGTKVFEGDIVKVVYSEMRDYQGVKYEDLREEIEQVVFKDGAFQLKMTFDGISFYRVLALPTNSMGVELKEIEVIGNIHDNKELL